MRPSDALERHRGKEVELAPPTWMTLHELTFAADVDDALDRLSRTPARFYETHVVRDDGGMHFLWQPDAAWDGGELTAPGPRHRISATPDGWILDRCGF